MPMISREQFHEMMCNLPAAKKAEISAACVTKGISAEQLEQVMYDIFVKEYINPYLSNYEFWNDKKEVQDERKEM